MSPSFFSNGSTPVPQDTLLVTTKKILGAAGGGDGGQVLQYVTNPNTESVKPGNTAGAALAYKAAGGGAIYQWKVSTQTWI